MVKTRKSKYIPDRSSPGSTRAVPCVGVPGHLVTNGLQDSGSSAEQPGQKTVVLLEEQRKRRKYTSAENREIMACYYKAISSKRGYIKCMYQLWKELYPNTDITEQRLADQRRFIERNKIFSRLELAEIQQKAQNNGAEHISDTNWDGPTELVKTSQSDTELKRLETEEEQEEEVTMVMSTVEPIQSLQLTERQEELRQKILENMNSINERRRLPPLKTVSREKLCGILKDVNKIMAGIQTITLYETNRLMYSAAVVITKELGVKIHYTEGRLKVDTPKWKIRLERKIRQLRSDASKLKSMKEKKLKNNKIRIDLVKRYHLDNKKLSEALEVIKQRLVAISEKIARFEARIVQFKQNQLFYSNQRQFYQNIGGGVKRSTEKPDREQLIGFWKSIWDSPKNYNQNAKWVNDIETELSNSGMSNLVIITKMVQNRVKKVKNWTAPGSDELHGFWLKKMTCLHERIAQQLNQVLQSGQIEEWMTMGKSFLIMKDQQKGPIASNYRPITCLPTTFKLFTGILADAIQNHLEINGLLPHEQKGNKLGSRGTKDQLLIDKMILENCKRRKTNLYVSWIDYRKAFDSLPHSWILHCLEIFGVSQNIKKLMENAMLSWKTELLVNGERMGKVNIQRGIFQGDSLSPLLFVIAMIPLSMILKKTGHGYQIIGSSQKICHLMYMDDLKLYGRSKNEIESLLGVVRIFSADIAMEFGLEKCATLELIKGKLIKCEGVNMPNGIEIKSLTMNQSYKYLGILQAENIKHAEVKGAVKKEYFGRVRRVLKSKLNGGNVIRAINTWAVPVVRYTAGIINWTQADLDILDRKTRKIMTINRALHPRSDIDRLYLKRIEGGRGLLQIKQCVEEEKRSLKEYVQESQEPALKEVHRANILKAKESRKEYRTHLFATRRKQWLNKPVHGQYFRAIEGKVDNKKTWEWLRRGTLKKETEGLILAAQEQALRTNAIKAKIEKSYSDSKCRLCKEYDETVEHLICGCKKIAQTDYIEHHNRLASMVHWNLCRKYGLPCSKTWYEHRPINITENGDTKILWDFRIQTDRHLIHNTPDITVVEKKHVWIIDVAVPGDSRVEDKEIEKITKYKDLQIEIERLWKKRVTIIPIVVGALGGIPRNLEKYLKILNLDRTSIHMLQKAALLGTAHILRKYL